MAAAKIAATENSRRTPLLAAFVALALAALPSAARAQSAPPPASAAGAATPGGSAGGDESSDLAKKLENPIGDLYNVPFQNNTNFGVGPKRGTQDVLNIQPVIPIHVTPDWNIITRTILPVVWSPSPVVPLGIGPTTFSAFLSPAEPTNGWLWGVGPIAQIPTITNKELGSSVWGAGPSVVLVYMKGPWVAGALANNVWSLGGNAAPMGNGYSTFLTQPFVNYNFGGGWYIGSSPIITADWQLPGAKWVVPIGMQGARVIKLFDKLPIDLLVGAYYNVTTPTYGAHWQLRTQIALIF